MEWPSAVGYIIATHAQLSAQLCRCDVDWKVKSIRCDVNWKVKSIRCDVNWKLKSIRCDVHWKGKAIRCDANWKVKSETMWLKVGWRAKCCVLHKKRLWSDAQVGSARRRLRAMFALCPRHARSSSHWNGGSEHAQWKAVCRILLGNPTADC